MARRHGATLDALATSWVLSHGFVDVALSGAVTTKQLESNIAALDLELSDGDRWRSWRRNRMTTGKLEESSPGHSKQFPIESANESDPRQAHG